MKRKMKLRLQDLQVSSFGLGSGGGVHAASYTVFYETCGCAISNADCVSQTGCPGGPMCVTQQYGGGDTCETGPVAYC